MIIEPATQPPRKRYTGISQPHTCSVGSTIGLCRVVTSSSIASLQVVDARLRAGVGLEHEVAARGDQAAHLGLRVIEVAEMHRVRRADGHARGQFSLLD